MFGVDERATDSIDAGLTTLADLQRQGLVRHVGLSSVTPQQLAAGRRICQIVCVQNKYNLAYRADDALLTSWLSKESRTSRFFRSAAGLRSSNLPSCPTWRNG